MHLARKDLVMVAVLISGTLLAVLNQTLLSPALPTIMSHLNVSATTVQWLTSGYSLVEAVIVPLSAYFIGRFSTRRLFIGGICLFAAGSLLAALAPVFAVLLLGRMMQAAATGIVMPMVMTLVLLVFPREQRGSAMGLIGLIIGFAPAVGPSLSGVLIDAIGWRALFLLVTALAVAVILFAAATLRNFEGFERTTFDVPSVALSSSGLLCLLYGLSTFTSTSTPAVSVALVVAGIAILAVFAKRQLSLENPLLNIGILKSRRYRTAALTIMVMQAALIGSEVIMPLFIQNILGHSATVSGLVMLPGAVLGSIMGFFAGRLFDRHGVRGLVLFGAAFLACGSLGYLFYAIDSSVLMVMAVYTAMALGLQMLMTPMNTWGINSLSTGSIQHANALSSTLNQVGGSFGTAFIVSLTALSATVAPQATGAEQTFAGYHLAFMGVVALLWVAILSIVLFVRNKPSDVPAQEAQNAQNARAKPGASMAVPAREAR